jgi:N-methylhydantoinase A
VQIVNLRSVHQAPASGQQASPQYRPLPGDSRKATRRILTETSREFVDTEIYERSRLAPGSRIDGPAVLEQVDTTTVIDPGWQALVDDAGNLIVTAGVAA